ncbi:MAG: PQQ-binding-like beta-propeller repeat protein [Gemmataceae bacterium]
MRSSALLLLAFVGPLALAGDWARFRGPNGTGVSADKGVPAHWTDKDVVFKAALPGVGHSSPIVVGDRVVLLSATNAERLVLCYDAATGKRLWSHSVPGAAAKKHAKSSWASSTPASDGERVYCVFWDGESVALHAYDLSGKALWKQDLGPFVSQHGPGFSPVVVDGKVIVNNDQDGVAALLAFDAATGKKAWEVERRPFRACYSTPIIAETTNSGKMLLVTSTAAITGYDVATGKELWNFTWSFNRMALRTVASSVVTDGTVIACSGDGSGERKMIGVKLDGQGDVTKTNLLWAKDKNRATPYVPTVVAQGKYVYGVLDEGQAFCFEAATGKEMWRGRRLAANVSASPLLIDGKVYVFDERGEVFVFAAEPSELKVLARTSVGEPLIASPAVANGRLYLRGERHLICVGKK